MERKRGWEMMIGFGSIEIETAKSIIRECYEAIKTDVSKAQDVIVTIDKKYKDIAEINKKLDRQSAPERYSYFWPRFIRRSDHCYTICFNFSHINRQHPLSPDGWAMMSTNWILDVETDETIGYSRIYQLTNKLEASK